MRYDQGGNRLPVHAARDEDRDDPVWYSRLAILVLALIVLAALCSLAAIAAAQQAGPSCESQLIASRTTRQNIIATSETVLANTLDDLRAKDAEIARLKAELDKLKSKEETK